MPPREPGDPLRRDAALVGWLIAVLVAMLIGPNGPASAQCVPGDYLSDSGACAAALPGHHAPGDDNHYKCLAGSFQSTGGQSECIAAPAGSFVAAEGATAATPCPPGFFQGARGQSECIAAPAGSFVAAAGAAAATPCPPGSFQRAPGRSVCVLAPAGSHVAAEGATAAMPCPAGSFQGARGQVACVPAPANRPALGEVWATVSIPAIGLDDVVVLEGTAAEQINVGVGHYTSTSFPWAGTGNVGLAGHRTGWGQPFNRLDELAVGDAVVIEANGAVYTSTVTGSAVVHPTETWVLRDVPPEVTGASGEAQLLTLTTCEGDHNEVRLIVWAELTDVAVNG